MEECPADILSEREIFWIEKLKTFRFGYNATKGGDGRPYVDSDLILSLYKDGKNVKEISELTDYDHTTVSKYLHNNGISHEEIWAKRNARLGKPIVMIDSKTGEELKIFSSMGEAARYLGITNDSSYGNIGRACKGKRKTAFGYKWRFL